MAQHLEELSQRRGIPSVTPDPARATSQIPDGLLGRDAAPPDPLVPKPLAKTRGEEHLPVPRRLCVSLSPCPFRKPCNLCSEGSLRRLRQCDVAINDVRHVGSFRPFAGQSKERLCRPSVEFHAGNQGRTGTTR